MSLLADAAHLPVIDRIQLIEELWDTVSESEMPRLSDEWREEIQKRSAEFDSGNSTIIPWSEIKANALNRLGAKDV